MPVSAAVGKALKQGRRGDSTGCGDNFAGGVIGSLARQLANEKLKMKNEKCEVPSTALANCQLSIVNCQFDLKEACRWGIVSGGFACFYYGGTYLEQPEGEKLSQLQELYDHYIMQNLLAHAGN